MAAGASRERHEPGRGIPDGVLVGILAALLATAVLVWLATGLGGWLQHGRWPDIAFPRTALAMRHLLTSPSDIQGAWRHPNPVRGLPSASVFWVTAGGLVLFLMLTVAAALSAWSRYRIAYLTRRKSAAAPTPLPAVAETGGPAVPVERAESAAPVEPGPRHDHTVRPEHSKHAEHTRAQEAGQDPAGRAEPARPHPLSEAALVPRARGIRPEIPVIGRGLHDVLAYGVHLGRDSHDGTELYAGLDQTLSLFGHFGPSSSGKGAPLVSSAVTTAPGPVLVTCDGPDTWQATVGAREKAGPVHVFDPLQLTDAAQRVRWSPVPGCADPHTADARARALLEPVRPLARTLLTDTATFRAAHTLLRCWLHAAALDHRPIRQVLRWAGGQASRDPVKILRTTHDAAPDWAGSLESALSGHQQQLDSARALTVRALDCLSQLHVLNSCTPSGIDALDVESYMIERGTLYVVGEALEAFPARELRTHPGVMPILTALVESVVEHGRRMAATSSAGRLDPPLLCVLDSVATLAPIPGLPDLMAVGGRTGLPTLAVLRSEEHARHRWGDRGGARIRDSANIRITAVDGAPGTARIQLQDGTTLTSTTRISETA